MSTNGVSILSGVEAGNALNDGTTVDQLTWELVISIYPLQVGRDGTRRQINHVLSEHVLHTASYVYTAAGKGNAFVAHANNQTIGMCIVSPVGVEPYTHKQVWEIGKLAVDPAARGQGVASRLMDAALQQLKTTISPDKHSIMITSKTPQVQGWCVRRNFHPIGMRNCFGVYGAGDESTADIMCADRWQQGGWNSFLLEGWERE